MRKKAEKPTLLHVSASPRGVESHSRRACKALVERLREAGRFDVVSRDLARRPFLFTDHAFADASLAAPPERDRAREKALASSEQLIGELENSGAIVIDTPMYNFTVPASLKAWIDLVVRPGRTFENTPRGKVGLLESRPVYLVLASGGPVLGGAHPQKDFLTPYLLYVLEIIGLRDVSILMMDRMRRGPDIVRAQEMAAEGWIARQADRFTSGLRR